MSKPERFTKATGAPVPDNTNILTAGRRGPALLQDIWLLEKLAHFDREVIPERRMHAKGWERMELSRRHTTLRSTPKQPSSRRLESRRRCSRVFRPWPANDTPVFFFRDPLRFPDLNHAVKRDPRTGLRSAQNNWDFWALLPESLHQATIIMSDRGIPKSFRHMHGFGSHRSNDRLRECVGLNGRCDHPTAPVRMLASNRIFRKSRLIIRNDRSLCIWLCLSRARSRSQPDHRLRRRSFHAPPSA